MATIIISIKELKKLYSLVCDGISLTFLKDVLPVIVTCITCMIVRCTLPAAWSHTIVTTLFKKGDLEEVANYRLIILSLLTLVSKIIEKIFAN